MRDSHYILIAVFIVLVSLLVFNISAVGISGFSTQLLDTQISVSPKTVAPGDILIINIIPGQEGSAKYVEFFQNNVKIERTTQLCRSFRCEDNILSHAFEIPANWYGRYEARIYDYYDADYVKTKFSVV